MEFGVLPWWAYVVGILYGLTLIGLTVFALVGVTSSHYEI